MEQLLFTASDAARFCQVDLKTIHNWADRGQITHFRTTGRHLRFRRNAILDFLREYGYPIPSLLSDPPSVYVGIVESDTDVFRNINRELGKRFEAAQFRDAIDAIASFGDYPPDALVIDMHPEGIDATFLFRRLRQVTSTSAMRVIAVSASGRDRDAAMAAGANGFVLQGDWAALRKTLGQLLFIGE